MRRLLGAPALAGALLAAVLAAGCATPHTAALRSERPTGLPDRAELAAVPFFPQEIHHCGPAALATVLAAAGVETTPEALAAQVYLPGREGALQIEMLAAVRRNGLVAYPLAPQLEGALREVAAGTPVVVLQNLGFDFVPIWHYAVIVGYDLEQEEIVLRSGGTRRLLLSLPDFERTWARSNYWAMLALPPSRLPATASEATFVSAAVALERSSIPAARSAYATALARWPENLVAEIGLGNTAYAMQDLGAAERAYRRASTDHPDAADAWNNLAQTLADLGRGGEAAAAAERAVALGGPRKALYEATLRDILQRTR